MTAADALGESLYAAHQKVYPREVSGRFARLRIAVGDRAARACSTGCRGCSWNGRQAVLFDLPARKFFIFGLTLFPQDFYLLTWLLIIAALSLFFFTALAGRLWCGYACPQTVWTEIFVWMERLTEGNRSQQIKLDTGALDHATSSGASRQADPVGQLCRLHRHDVRRLLLADRGLAAKDRSANLSFWEAFWVIFYGVATYGNAGFLREQVCKYMCPYARFQSAMFDRNTLIISYDAARGEPRGSRGRGGAGATRGGQGDCIDCTLCVQACPTGIDIRKGLQYECIACAACIDACDAVMEKVGSPPGLVRYSTQAEIDGDAESPAATAHR